MATSVMSRHAERSVVIGVLHSYARHARADIGNSTTAVDRARVAKDVRLESLALPSAEETVVIGESRDLRRLCRLDSSTDELLHASLDLMPAPRGEVFRVAASYRLDDAASLDALVVHGAQRDATLAAFASIATQPTPFLTVERAYASITGAQCWSQEMERGTDIVGCADFVGSVMNLRGGRYAVLGAGTAEAVSAARSRSVLRRNVLMLLKANLRLRHVLAGGALLEGADAVFETDGRLLCTADPALFAARRELIQAVRAREATGAFEALAPERALDHWHELTAATLVFFDYVDTDHRRYVVGLRAREHALASLALSREEKLVIERMLVGGSNKVIADELAVSCSTVTEKAACGLRKLGARSLVELSAVMRAQASLVLAEWPMGEEVLVALGYRPSGAEALAALSPSERAVAAATLAGASMRAVALARGSSVRTVGNQLGSCYRKLQVSGRRELMAKLARDGR
jgi:DNA-binding NarL/FixJ family response regulator